MILFVRTGQIVLGLCFIWFLYGEHNTLSWITVGIPLLVFEIFMLSVVFATLNEDGLAYQRWNAWKQVTWAEMSYGGVAPVGFIRVKLAGRSIWSRYLLLRAPDPPLQDQEAVLPGALRFCEVMEPPSGRTN